MKTSAVKITKKEFNATLVAERTAQIACCNGKINRFNDIVAVLNDTEKMQNVKDNAEWRTVTKTRANGVTFSNGSTLDYKANAEYYRVGNVIIVVNVSEVEDFDAAYNRVNVPYYNVMAYLIDAPELETPDTMNAETKAMNEENELSNAGYCLDVYIMNDQFIYENCTQKAIEAIANEGLTINSPEVVEHIKRAVRQAASEVHLHDGLAVTPEDIKAVLPNYCAYIIECAKYEVENC